MPRLDRFRTWLGARRGDPGSSDLPDRLSPELIRGVHFTALKDPKTCAACAAADDDLLRRLDDAQRMPVPHPECTSPEGCRCMEFYVLLDEAEPPDGWNWSPESEALNRNRPPT